ncbi:MAG: sensor histidine kinase [Opitutaceae bacterium]
MSPPEADRAFVKFSNLALLFLVAMTVAMALASPSFAPFSAHAVLFYGLMAVFGGVGVYVDLRVFGKMPPWVEWLYFALQLGFYGALIVLKMPHSAIWLLTMPVMSQAAMRLPWPVVAGYGISFLVINCWLPTNPGWDNVDRWRTALSLASAYVFVVATTLIVETARRARARAETLAEQLEQANAQLRAAAGQAAELAAATERNRIARDIHDGLGHFLTVVAVQTEAARALLPAQPERASEAIAKAEQSARAALADVRRSVGALRDFSPKPPLRVALAGLVQECGLPATFACLGEERPLGEAAEQALFRAAQEGLTNARKHAGAAAISVTLDYRSGSGVAVEVVDNGADRIAAPGSGYGLLGLRERLVAVGGALRAGPRPQGGFALRAEVPV